MAREYSALGSASRGSCHRPRSWMPMIYGLPSMCASDSEEECCASAAPRDAQLVAEKNRLQAVLETRRELRDTIVAEACIDCASAASCATAAAELDKGIRVTSERLASVRDEIEKSSAARFYASFPKSSDDSSIPAAGVEALYPCEDEEAEKKSPPASCTPPSRMLGHASNEQQCKARLSLVRFEDAWLRGPGVLGDI
jgi:hypothetical protein